MRDLKFDIMNYNHLWWDGELVKKKIWLFLFLFFYYNLGLNIDRSIWNGKLFYFHLFFHHLLLLLLFYTHTHELTRQAHNKKKVVIIDIFSPPFIWHDIHRRVIHIDLDVHNTQPLTIWTNRNDNNNNKKTTEFSNESKNVDDYSYNDRHDDDNDGTMDG